MSSQPPPQPPLVLASLDAQRPLLGATTTLTLVLHLARDVDPLDVHRRLLELVEELRDAQLRRRERGGSS